MNLGSDSAVRTALESPLDILADELGSVAGRIERELRQGYEATIAKLEARIAALELAAMRAEAEREAKVLARLAEVKNGVDGKDADISHLVAEFEQIKTWSATHLGELNRELTEKVNAKLTEVKDGKDGEPGKDADIEPLVERFYGLESQLRDFVETSQDGLINRIDAKLAQVKDGKDGRDGIDGSDGERGPEGPPGKLPIAKQWTKGVYYEGEAVIHAGSTYQALRNTGDQPPGDDWQPLAIRGSDARGFAIRSTYNPEADYHRNDVVAFNGSSFVALIDDPGKCPGDGWQLLASAGKRGERGPPGEKVKGDPGKPGASIIAGEIDADTMTLVFVNSEGEKVIIDLYPLAEALHSQ